MAQRGWSRIDNAEGKSIESVEIVRFDIIEEHDPAPAQLNWFHATTRRDIVERELLLRAGRPFRQQLSDETERNLRALGLFSVVVTIPVAGSHKNSIRYLVITKDIWSLRAGWDGRFANGVVDRLSVRPSEINLLGAGRRVSGSLALTPRVIQVGLGTSEPRLGGTRLRLGADFSATINCNTGNVEGYLGSFQYTHPLYSTQARWAYATSVSLSQGIVRLRGAQGRGLCQADNSGEIALPVDDRELGDPDRNYALVPNEYTYDTQSFNQSFTRSYGRTVKTNLTWGFSASRAARRTVSMDNIRLENPMGPGDTLTPEELSAARNWYLRVVRPSTRQYSPYVQLVSYQNQWHRDMHAETLGLQESFRLGPVASLRLYSALKQAGSSRSFAGLRSFASYATRVGTGYAKAQISHTLELASTHEDSNSELTLRLRFNSPHTRYGRLVVDQQYTRVGPNFNSRSYVLDNTFRLRGYRASLRSRALYGREGFAVSNIELRSRPVQFFSTLLGVVAFYDAGDAFNRDEVWKIHHGAGLGIRFLAPQLDREVLRVDVGFPLNPNDPLGEMTVNATFGQAFSGP